jgi:hypothetical protein
MCVLSEQLPRGKHAVTATLQVRPGDGENFGVVTLSYGPDAADYYLTPVPSDWGVAYRLDKMGDEEARYHVLLDPLAEGGLFASCECKGHLRWGYCRHVHGLLLLRERGEL